MRDVATAFDAAAATSGAAEMLCLHCSCSRVYVLATPYCRLRDVTEAPVTPVTDTRGSTVLLSVTVVRFLAAASRSTDAQLP